jgi:hypothetical protein
MLFWGEKEKNCASRFEGKKAVMPWEMRDCSWHHNCTGTGYSSTVLFWFFQEINGVKVATDIILVFKSADN